MWDIIAGLVLVFGSCAVLLVAFLRRAPHMDSTGTRPLPGNLGSDTWPQLDEWEADTEEAITQALRDIADAHPVPGSQTPVFDALTSQHPWVIEQLHPEEFAELRAALADEDRVERWLA